jgi:23S rRNA (adenine2030-N6)-methyltransferase
MLSYQHVYHAGNHADILKHYVLTFVLSSLNKKDKPYTFFDTHSGSGLYDLTDSRSLKTSEAEIGIMRLIKAGEAESNAVPAEMNDYLNFVKQYTDKGFYPGSPEIERSFMRQNDVLVLSELHPQEIENLRENMGHNGEAGAHNLGGDKHYPAIQIHKRDGWEMINATTPPATKRGGVLIDPSYEESQDYIDAAESIIKVHKKWSNGIILLWYPLLEHREKEIEKMLGSITQAAHAVNENTEIVNLQLCVNAKESYRLYGSGMLVINAPWKLKEEGEKVVDFLTKCFQ